MDTMQMIKGYHDNQAAKQQVCSLKMHSTTHLSNSKINGM